MLATLFPATAALVSNVDGRTSGKASYVVIPSYEALSAAWNGVERDMAKMIVADAYRDLCDSESPSLEVRTELHRKYLLLKVAYVCRFGEDD